MGEDDHIGPEMHGALHFDGVVDAVDFLDSAIDEALGPADETPTLFCPPLEFLHPVTPEYSPDSFLDEAAADASLPDPPAALPSSPCPAPQPEALPNLEGDAEIVKLPVV